MADSENREGVDRPEDRDYEHEPTSGPSTRQSAGVLGELDDRSEMDNNHRDTTSQQRDPSEMLPSSPPGSLLSHQRPETGYDNGDEGLDETSDRDSMHEDNDDAADSGDEAQSGEEALSHIEDGSHGARTLGQEPAQLDQKTPNLDDRQARGTSSGSITEADPEAPLRPHDWDGLLERFEEEMRIKEDEWNELENQWQTLMRFRQLWAEAGPAKETERAAKRLKTRIAYVQSEEQELARRKDHHKKVVMAFQRALGLLDET